MLFQGNERVAVQRLKAVPFDGDFDVSVRNLQELAELRGIDACNEIKYQYGGVEKLCTSLKVLSAEGLSGLPEDMKLRKNTYGSNTITQRRPQSFWAFVWDALHDTTLIILILCATISFTLTFYQVIRERGKAPRHGHVVDHGDEDGNGEAEDRDLFGGMLDSGAILIAVIIIVLVTSINDWSKDRKFRSLQSKIDDSQRLTVLRGKSIVQIQVANLVVGDICLVKYGDIVPADGVLIQSHDLKTDESTLTGESRLVKKGIDVNPILLSGTKIMEGSARMLVIAVGDNSQAGILHALIAADSSVHQNNKDSEVDSRNILDESASQGSSAVTTKKTSILKDKLTWLAIKMGLVGLVMGILTFLVLSLQFSIKTFVMERKAWNLDYLNVYISFLILGIGVLVVAIPEGLPLAITVSLAYSVKRMMDDHNMVRHLDACETMGHATTICSDKTGTLTANRMTVTRSYACGQLYDKLADAKKLPDNVIDLIASAISINSSYTSQILPIEKTGSGVKHLGNSTECALLGFVGVLGRDYNKYRTDTPDRALYKVYTFNSSRKSMSTVVVIGNGYRLYSKGASEIILSKCSFIMNKDGKVVQFGEAERLALIDTVIKQMASDSLRTICVAYKDFVFAAAGARQEPHWEDEDHILADLTCLCIVGMEDPVRPEVPDAIATCQNAGITVVMVTGDNLETARSVALKCGIVPSRAPRENTVLVLDGKAFNQKIRFGPDRLVSQQKLDAIWPNLRVLARSSPLDKLTLVNGIIENKLRPKQEVVAVTGDGTNDGPALRRADVGFAMGIAGTDVAKNASDIIITDDNFSSIVKAVMWGRGIFDNISKFLQFQITVNIVSVTTVFLGACIVSRTPLSAVQMLWVNMIMDTLASLALATELPTEELLHRKPYPRHQAMISPFMWRFIVGHAAYQLIIIMVLLFRGGVLFDIEDLFSLNTMQANEHSTMVFNTFVLMTLFNELNARKIHGERNVLRGISKSYAFMFIWILTIILQVLIVEVFGRFFNATGLSVELWLWSFAIGVSELLWGQILMSIPILKIVKFLGKHWIKYRKPSVVKSRSIIDIDEVSMTRYKVLWLRSYKRVATMVRMINDRPIIHAGAGSLASYSFSCMHQLVLTDFILLNLSKGYAVPNVLDYFWGVFM